MPWLKIDTGFTRHRKALRLSYEERWHHLEAMCWCAEMETDGRIEVADLQGIWPGISRPKARQLTTRLTAAGVWDEEEGGWQIHDWLEYNISREDSRRQREQHAERVRRWRERRNGDASPTPSRNGSRDASKDAHATLYRGRVDPTRPDPPLKGGRGEGDALEARPPSPGPEEPPREATLEDVREVAATLPEGSPVRAAMLAAAKRTERARGRR